MNMAMNNVNFGGMMPFQMMNNERGPPPTSNETIDSLPEYRYFPRDSEDEDLDLEDDSDDEEMSDEMRITIEGADDKDSAQSKDDVTEPIAVEEMKEDLSNDNVPSAPPNDDDDEELKESDTETKTNDTSSMNRECAICKDRFRKGDLLMELPCKHRYHKECIMPWITKRNTCPTCRYRMPTDNQMYEQMQNARENAQNGNANGNGNGNGNGNFQFNMHGVPMDALFQQIFNQQPMQQMQPNANANANIGNNGNSNGNLNGNSGGNSNGNQSSNQ